MIEHTVEVEHERHFGTVEHPAGTHPSPERLRMGYIIGGDDPGPTIIPGDPIDWLGVLYELTATGNVVLNWTFPSNPFPAQTSYPCTALILQRATLSNYPPLLTTINPSDTVNPLETNVTLANTGSGYHVDDILTFVGGDPNGPDFGTDPTQIKVRTVDGGGHITRATFYHIGAYQKGSVPSNPITLTGGFGTGATATWSAWQVYVAFSTARTNTPVTDTNWTTIHTWGPANLAQLPTTYTDSYAPANGFAAYRLTLLVPNQSSNYQIEIDWNVVEAIAPMLAGSTYPDMCASQDTTNATASPNRVCVRYNEQTKVTTIGWSPPNVSLWP